MEFDNDISLGEGLAKDQGDCESGQNNTRELAQSSSNRGNLMAGLIVSSLLHMTIAAVFLRSSVGTMNATINGAMDNPVPSTVRIQFVPSNPLLATTEEEPETPEVLEDEEAVFEEPVIEEQLIEQALVESSTEEIETEQLEPGPSQVAEQAELVESSTTDQAPTVTPATNPTLTPPTLLAIQQSLETIESERASRFYSYDCNVIEQKEDIRECEPNDNRDFSSLVKNSVYDFHNPVRELSRSEKTVTAIARESRSLAGRLAQAGLPSGRGAYLLEQMEISIEINSNNGNRVARNMNMMVDSSAAAIQARRVFDPWVQQQTKVLGARKVYNKQELDQQRRCSDIVLAFLTLPPGEFASCWTVGDKPLLLLQLLGL